MLEERRLSKRKTLERLTYIDLLSDNGGIVTDVSEGGLGFCSAAPLGKSGIVQFRLSGDTDRIEGTGDVVWTDKEKKTGGLRFIELPQEVREHIRSWPYETHLPLDAAGKSGGQIPAADHLLPDACSEGVGRASLNSSLTSGVFPSPDFAAQGAPGGKRSVRILKAAGLVGAIGVLSYVCYRQAREWLTESKKSGPGERPTQTLTHAPVSQPAFQVPSDDQVAGDGQLRGDNSAAGEQSEAAGGATREGTEPGTSEPLGTARARGARPVAELTPAALQTPAAGRGAFFVQVAAYTNEREARKLVEKLEGRRFAAFVRPPVDDEFYRVQLGPYGSLESARVAYHELEKAGFTPFIRH